jgi:hypothetical protein
MRISLKIGSGQSGLLSCSTNVNSYAYVTTAIRAKFINLIQQTICEEDLTERSRKNDCQVFIWNLECCRTMLQLCNQRCVHCIFECVDASVSKMIVHLSIRYDMSLRLSPLKPARFIRTLSLPLHV